MTHVSIIAIVEQMGRLREFDREKALDSAILLFREKGFGATTTEDLRLAMGIGRQSFYSTFKGKKEIYLEALRKYNSTRLSGYIENFRKSKSPMEAIESLLLSIALEDHNERSLACLGVSSICEFGASDRDISSVNITASMTLETVLAKLVREGQAQKEIRSNLPAKDVADFLMAFVAGLRVSARGGASPVALKKMVLVAVCGLKEG